MCERGASNFHRNRHMTAERLPCKNCSAMVLPTTTEVTNGLCMPCWRKQEREKQWQYRIIDSWKAAWIRTKRARVVFGIFVGLVLAAQCFLDLPNFAKFETYAPGRRHWRAMATPQEILGVSLFIGIPLVCILYGIRKNLFYVEIVAWMVWLISIVMYFI